jgi:hypothetical protein
MQLPNPYAVRNEDFLSPIDVVCPRCRARALVAGARPYAALGTYEEELRFSCTSCGYAIKYANTPKFPVFTNSRGVTVKGRLLLMNTSCDPFFGFTLWYRIETTDGLLWAYNLAHLTVIELYIADPLRSRNGLPDKNNSLASRLPKWVGAAKNRAYLLRLIGRFKGA